MNISIRLLIVSAITITTLAACRKSESTEPGPGYNAQAMMRIASSNGYPGNPTGANFCNAGITRILYAGQNIDAGTITIRKDFASGIVYVTYTATGNWYLTGLHLYIAEQDSCAIPVNSAGAPQPGQFPLAANLTATPLQSYTFAITGLTGNCFCVAAHANLVQVTDGQVIQTQTGWGDGVKIMPNGNWSTKFDVCIPVCDPNGGGDNM